MGQTIRALSILLAFSAISCVPQRAATRSGAENRPSILVILADDMGYSDLGAYGGEIRTPNVDRLAAGGLRFRQFYNAARCSPTRAALLTGRYPHVVGMGDLAPGLGRAREPGPYQGYLPESVVTIADALRAAGYRTYMSGKWHVGDEPEHWPRQHGFDRYFGLISGASSYYELLEHPRVVRQMVLEDERWTPPAEGFYMTDAFTDYAVERIREHSRTSRDRPFFLYLAYNAPHWPLHAPAEDIARYRGRYDIGWDSLRAERYVRMRAMGVLTERHVLTTSPVEVPAWDTVTHKADWARRMEVYAAMVDRMDQGIGRVMQALRETGYEENTLVLFLSDNGASPESLGEPGPYEGDVPMGARGTYEAYREPWAHASNTPFRLYKRWVHEGGVITPLVAYWPAGSHRSGGFTDVAGHVIDIFPTALELAGAEYPRTARGPSEAPLEGRSFAALLRGGDQTTRNEPLYWAHGGNWAVREGDWKLVYDASRARRMELFNLAADPTEQRDLSMRHPDQVSDLRAKWLQWAERVGAREGHH